MIANSAMFTVQNLASAAGQEMPRFIQPGYLSLCLFKCFNKIISLGACSDSGTSGLKACFCKINFTVRLPSTVACLT
jgi:hypothetical protein